MLDIKKLSSQEQKELAQNENTIAEILTQLALGADEIKQLVAENPNTPVETLEKLSNLYYEEIIDNPVFELLLLENGDRDFLELCLAKSVRTSAETLEELLFDAKPNVRDAVKKNPNLSRETIVKFLQQVKRRNISFGRRGNASVHAIYSLNASQGKYAADWILGNVNLPPNILDELAEYPSKHIRQLVAQHPNTSAHTLAKIADDSALSVRRAVMRNKNTSIASLVIITKQDRQYGLRKLVFCQLIEGDKLIEALEILATSSDWLDRKAAAGNIQTPIAILEKLSADYNRYIRGAAKKNLENISSNSKQKGDLASGSIVLEQSFSDVKFTQSCF